MPQFRKKPVTIEAITFEELVQHGLFECTGHPDRVVNGMPWSFHYKGHPITHEHDDCYCIPTLEGMMHFKRGDMLITGVKGEIYPCRADIFAATYEDASEPNNCDAPTSAEEVRDFQDGVRGMLLQELEKRGIKEDIDGSGCDSGDWRDFTMSEIQQGFNRLADHFFDKAENCIDELDPVTVCEHLRKRFAGLFVFMNGKEGTISYHGGDLTGAKSRLAEAYKSPVE